MQIIAAGRPADVIAHAWYRLGHRPTDSLVLVGLFPGRAGRLTTGAVLRADLPPQRLAPATLDALMRTLARTGHRAVVALIPAGPPASGARAPVQGPLTRRRLARSVQAAARRARLQVTDVIGIDDQAYRSYLCPDDRCCPPRGLPLQDVATSPVALAHVMEGQVLLESEDAVVADTDPASVPLVDQALLGARTPADPGAVLALWEDLVGRHPEPAAAHELADLCRALDDVVVRDALLASAVHPAGPTGPRAAGAVLAGQGSEVFATLDRVRPDEDRAQRVRAVLAAVARHVPEGRRAGALAVLAWVMWWCGDGLAARRYAERAVADVPDHRLGHLVLQVLEAGILPAWTDRARRELVGADPTSGAP